MKSNFGNRRKCWTFIIFLFANKLWQFLCKLYKNYVFNFLFLADIYYCSDTFRSPFCLSASTQTYTVCICLPWNRDTWKLNGFFKWNLIPFLVSSCCQCPRRKCETQYHFVIKAKLWSAPLFWSLIQCLEKFLCSFLSTLT